MIKCTEFERTLGAADKRYKMINLYEVTETNKMIEEENLDVRTITMGISLLDCSDSNLQV